MDSEESSIGSSQNIRITKSANSIAMQVLNHIRWCEVGTDTTYNLMEYCGDDYSMSLTVLLLRFY